jgi:acyl carrier protein
MDCLDIFNLCLLYEWFQKGNQRVDTFVPPQDATRKRLVEIWSDLLATEKEKLSIDTNFFELGGHSLKAVLMTAKIHQRFDTNLSMMEIFKKPTIREIATLIDAFAWTGNPKINQRGKRDEALL